ncbi:WD repeat-containing protein [Ceratobasidium sp. AG-Ba]|nr:WD repeat-containing protein [Ceratobasidium sp. AG-Ba]QRW06855.1 WD repeat-containing protein [Ceratobasidium sp. AG-Ba]
MDQLRRLRISRRKPLDDYTDHTEIGSTVDSHTTIQSKPATAKLFIEAPNTAVGNNSSAGRSVGDVLAKWNCLGEFSHALSKYDDSFDHFKTAVEVFSGLIFTFEVTNNLLQIYRGSSVGIFETILGAIGRYQTIQANFIKVFNELDARFMNEGIQQSRPIIFNISRTLEQAVKFAETTQFRSWSNRMINGVHDFDEVLACYQGIQSCLDMISLNATTNKKTPADEVMMGYGFERLRVLSSADYRSSELAVRCAPETQTHALEQLLAWVDDNKERNIHWINGMPGTAKTTLLYSLCEILESTHRLAGSSAKTQWCCHTRSL